MNQIGVKFCGGCNPQIDSLAVIRELRSILPEGHQLVTNPQRGAWETALLICACPTACADRPEIRELAHHWILVSGPMVDSMLVSENELSIVVAKKLCNLLNALSMEPLTKVVKANDALSLIRDIKTKVKILGGCAAIEAPRADDYWRTITVVTDDIRKLADNPNLSTRTILEVIKETKEITAKVSENSLILDEYVKNEVAFISEACSSIKQLQATMD